MIDYKVERIPCKTAKEYIIKNHYSHGCHNAPSPCYGLFDNKKLIGVLMFATPCSENVRASIFGVEYKDRVIELHRLHILDVTPKNAESYFISRCLKLLLKDKPQIRAVVSFSDLTQGHSGVIYYWHISDLVIYDNPKELTAFEKACDHDCAHCNFYYGGGMYEPPSCEWEEFELTRPPQSWCYVEGI